MPIIRVVSDQKLGGEEVNQIKVLGSLLGYHDPRCIWVETSGDLTQDDVMAVTVQCEKRDFESPVFGEFCARVGAYLRDATNKSVEILRPIDGGVESLHWAPTKYGEQIYGDAS